MNHVYIVQACMQQMYIMCTADDVPACTCGCVYINVCLCVCMFGQGDLGGGGGGAVLAITMCALCVYCA